MKNIFTKAVAVTASLTLAFTLASSVTAPVKAEDNEVSLTKWSFYQGGASFRSDKDAWAQRFYRSVTVGSETITAWGNPDAVTPETTITAKEVSNSFTADILTTGWDGNYETVDEDGNCGDNNPFMLRASMKNIAITTGHRYNLSFTASWTRDNEKAPEKNIMVAVNNSDESVFASNPDAVTKIKVTNGDTAKYSQDFTVWSGDGTLSVDLAYGAFLYDFNHKLTTEDVAASGTLEITDVKIVDLGQDPSYEPQPEPLTEEPTTATPATTKAPVTTKKTPSTTTAAAKAFAKVTKVKAKNNKKKTLTISWKKISKVKKYQVKVGTKKYYSKKNKLVVKKLKKKTYKVKVRALAANGFKTGAWSKTIKAKVKK